MSIHATWQIDAGLGGSYRETVLADANLEGFWPMDEYRLTVADDKSANAHDGTYLNTPTLGQLGPCPEGGCVPYFDASQSMDVADHADHRPANLSVECWIYPTLAGTDRPILIKANNTLTNGFGFLYSSADVVAFFVNTAANNVTTDVDLDTWTHLVATYDGTNIRLYKNGALADGPTSGGGAITHSTTTMRVGTHGTFANSFLGRIAHVALYSAVLNASDALAHYTAGSWTDLTDDVDGRVPLTIRRGIRGFTPRDRMAAPGAAQFALRNHRLNSGGVRGYYSPGHASCRAGFTFGIPIRITATAGGSPFVQFRGKLNGILPDGNTVGDAKAWCTADDCLYNFAQHVAREVSLQVDQGEDDLILELLEALPFDARPPAIALSTGVDTYPYGFDDLGDGRSILNLLADIMVSSQGLGHVNGDGTFVYYSRTAMQTHEVQESFTDTDLSDIDVASDLSNTYNRIRIKTHPKTVDASTVVLYSHPGVISVPPGMTTEIWGAYRHPSRPEFLCGGTDMQTVTATTDYLANSAADGSGSNITANVPVVGTFFGSDVKFAITNNHGSLTAYLGTGTNLLLQCRGKGVYDLSPVTVEAFEEMPYGDRALELDTPFLDDSNVAQDLADALLLQLKDLVAQPRSFSVNPQRRLTLMGKALVFGAALNQPIDLSEAQTGVNGSSVFVRSIDFSVGPQGWFSADFGVTPRTSSEVWQLDIDQLGTETILGAG